MLKWIRWALKGSPKVKCHYCDNEAAKTLVWLRNKRHEPARITLPWCGCDLMAALRRFWPSPYPVVEGEDYEVLPGLPAPKGAA